VTSRIYYFSGTGNTLWSAKRIAEALDSKGETPDSCEIFSIAAEMATGTDGGHGGSIQPICIKADRVVLLFPSYAYQTPLLVRNFLLRAEINAPYIAALVTYGTNPKGTLSEVCRILRRKNIVVSFFGSIPCVENYIPIFGPQPQKTIEQRLALQKQSTYEIAAAIRAGNTSPRPHCIFRPFSMFVSSLFRTAKPLMARGYKVSGLCNNCGLCVKLCPVNAVIPGKAGPEISGRCEQCQACLNWCPQRAIAFGRMKKNTPRYHHPEVAAQELL
jgi:ferredoxin